jgi:hypothetical protein
VSTVTEEWSEIRRRVLVDGLGKRAAGRGNGIHDEGHSPGCRGSRWLLTLFLLPRTTKGLGQRIGHRQAGVLRAPAWSPSGSRTVARNATIGSVQMIGLRLQEPGGVVLWWCHVQAYESGHHDRQVGLPVHRLSDAPGELAEAAPASRPV